MQVDRDEWVEGAVVPLKGPPEVRGDGAADLVDDSSGSGQFVKHRDCQVGAASSRVRAMICEYRAACTVGSVAVVRHWPLWKRFISR